MNRAVFGKVAKAKALAENGVDYSPWHGARYHRCDRKGCVIASLRVSIKSIEVDG